MKRSRLKETAEGVENALLDEQGEEVGLKPGADVEVTIVAAPNYSQKADCERRLGDGDWF